MMAMMEMVLSSLTLQFCSAEVKTENLKEERESQLPEL